LHLPLEQFTARSEATYWLRISNSAYPTGRNIAMPFGMEKLKWCGYPTVKNFDDTIIRFYRIHEHDGHTDRQTPHDG